MKKEVELPALPKRLFWEWEQSVLPLLNSNVSALQIMRLRIVKRWGWFSTELVTGDWFALMPGDIQDKEATVRMHSDMLILQLPGKFHVGGVDTPGLPPYSGVHEAP